LAWTESYFRTKGIASPRLDAELLLAHSLSVKRLDLYLQFDRPLAADELTRFRELVRRRAERTPVTYLTGEVGFWSLTLHIAPGVLIPRPDTETLVEAVLAAVAELRGLPTARHVDPEPELEPEPEAIADESSGNDFDRDVTEATESAVAPEVASPAAAPPAPRAPLAPLTVFELGVGSGAIPLAVCAETEGVTWVGVDRTAAALSVAQRNRVRHAALLEPRRNRLWLVGGDGFAALRESADLIVSNPPYIPSATIVGLMPEVAKHEPRAALDGGADGLDFYRVLIAEAAARLRLGGRMLVELGHDQVDAVRRLVAAQLALEVVGTRDDLGGHVRVLDVRRK
jgi:release factor glutamine methyltransferase